MLPTRNLLPILNFELVEFIVDGDNLQVVKLLSSSMIYGVVILFPINLGFYI